VRKITFLISFISLYSFVCAGVTGKVSGRITNADSGEPLIGANVILKGTVLGAASDLDGYYSILNVRPGYYDLQVNMIGFAEKSVIDVRVEVDLTAFIDIPMTVQALSSEVIVVQANQKLVKTDVASSQKSISSDQISDMPVSSVSDVVGLSAGVSGLSVRGGSLNETQFMVDGLVLNDERTSEPTTGIPLSSVQDISLQTGGFGAEYSNARSGIINVVTREGSKENYNGTISLRRSPAAQKHFGSSPYDSESFWLKPYLDDEVAWTGTNNGAWDEYQQRQYPSFDGWNSISEQTLVDSDPNNDLSPAGAQKLFTWEHRLNGAIKDPDINLDAGFGGPVPLISSKFGDLRFFASTLYQEDMYLFEISKPSLKKQSSLFKLTADVKDNSKLVYTFFLGSMEGTTLSRGGGTSIVNDVWDLASQVDRDGFTMPWRLFTNEYWSPTKVDNSTHALKFTQQNNEKSFFDFLIKIDHKTYLTDHGPKRDTASVFPVFGEGEDIWYADEAPLGFFGGPVFSVEGSLAFGGAVSTSRDFSKIKSYTIKGNYVLQLNNHHQIKTGGEIIISDLNLKFGSQNEFLPSGNYWSESQVNPYRLSFYGQDKIEYRGFVSTIGINLDVLNPNGSWYDVDEYDDDFFSSNYTQDSENNFDKKTLDSQVELSPRLAISHPITETSKLYFNYGHYHQMPIAEDLYRIRRGFSEEVLTIGDPSLPMSKTISYEVGFDQSFLGSYLIHLAAYYKDIRDQQNYTQYISANSKVNYSQLTANSYEDIRGFELEFSRLRGNWVTGFVNYEYRVNTAGYFGLSRYYENPGDQRNFELTNIKQSKPRPIPSIKSVLNFHTPEKFGPSINRKHLLGDWHMNVISRWSKGSWFTYNPNNVPGIEYNVQFTDRYNIDLKFSKVLSINRIKIKLYADIYNAFNIKNFSGYGFEDGFDYNYYMQSLHMSKEYVGELGYEYFEGDDKPGDVRATGTKFVPMEWVSDINYLVEPSERPIYYDNSTGKYLQWSSAGGWQDVDQSYYDRVLENKQYIDMPNQTYFVFLNPRDIFFGVNISYDF